MRHNATTVNTANPTTLADRVKLAIRLSGTNCTAIAAKSGLCEVGIRKIYLGKIANPRMDTIRRIAEATGQPVAFFFYGFDAQPETRRGN